MAIHVIEQEQFLPISMEEAWEFFSSPRNLEKITPDDLGFEITSLRSDQMYEGQIISYKVMVFPKVWVPWVTEITSVDQGKSFVDEQRFGPYKLWHHRHVFEPVEGGVKMSDLVHYSIGFWPFGEIAHKLFVKEKVERIFEHRKEFLQDYFPEKQGSS